MLIYVNLLVPESQLLHTKFQGNQPSGSREEDFKAFTLYGHAGHLGHVTWTKYTNFCFENPVKAPYEIWVQSTQWVLR